MKETNFSHVFSICAYKESPYLEECVESLKKQRVQSEIIICTSTPCDFIRKVAQKYEVPLHVREGKSDIRDDWNFAYNTACGEYITIAHQDDVYNPYYVEEMQKKTQENEDNIIFLTDYFPLKNGEKRNRDINSKIRRVLRIPLKNRFLSKKKWVRKMTLAFGNSICCPSVTYHKGDLGEDVFTSEYKFNIDWDTFYKLSLKEGSFAYVDKPLVWYRIHDEATSKAFIDSQLRIEEDTDMFRQFWPEWIVKLLMIFYRKAYDTYNS
jgi:glycosyltransferase involved in cell wall biosynthesis